MFKRWLYQMVSLLFAWTILLATSGLVDDVFNTVIHFFVIAWLCIGLGVMLAKKVNFPLPQANRIDVPGAFRMLWWAAFWPRYVGKK